MRQVRRASVLILCVIMTACAGGYPGEQAFRRGEHRLAAEQGYPEAQWLLGDAYARGLGVEPDLEAAVRWYRAAAERGHARAGYELGLAFQQGRGIPRSMLEAARWFRTAAEAGDPDAQFEFGKLCFEGRWVRFNP
ncbi:MAG: tetratricopeptide repeat protein, partial [Myxococcota bacterium]